MIKNWKEVVAEEMTMSICTDSDHLCRSSQTVAYDLPNIQRERTNEEGTIERNKGKSVSLTNTELKWFVVKTIVLVYLE